MLENYLKTALRNLLRYKGFAAINVFGLTIGIAGCLAIGLFVWDERQYDKNIPEAASIYRLYDQKNNNNLISYQACTPPAFATFLKTQYPEVEATARMLMSGDKFLMEAGDKKEYEEKGWFVDSSFIKMFSLKLRKGDAATALDAPRSVVISEDIASRYYGKDDPIDKLIRINKDTMVVKGVLAKLPSHFHLDFRYLMTLSAAGIPKDRMGKWTWLQFYSYVKLKPGADVQQLQNKFQAYMKKDIFPTLPQKGSTFLPFFQPLKSIHLQSSDFIYDNALRGNETYVKALTIIALFVLAIACFNFINLATARSLRRAKEIGVRKVAGAGKRQIVFQFLSETVFLSLFSVVIATVITFFVVPALNRFTGKSIEFNPFTHPLLALFIIAGGMAIGIIAGLYPAFILSRFQPVKVLKSMKFTGGGGTSWLRHALVVVQFALSALLIVSAIIVYKQTAYLNDKDLGFSKEQIVYFQVRGDVKTNLETFKSELKRSPNIMAVTSGYGLPGDQFAGDGVSIQTDEGEKEHAANVFIGDYDYVKALGLKLIAGRDFSRAMSTDVDEAFLINETAVKEFGYGNPEKAIGQPVSWNEWEPKDTTKPVKRGRVIGVVKDFHYKSLHEKITASVIQLYPQITFKVAAKLKTTDIRKTIAYINTVWNTFSPGYPLDYKFMDETYGKMYDSEEKLASLLWLFTVMAIVVGCLGLFGLAAFSAEQRVKEIGIRKVLGASVAGITVLLSKTFLKPVLIASLLAFPVAWWAMNKWLEDFPYRITISWWIFFVATVIALAIALLTIGFQTIKAAVANPVKSLRTE